MKKIFKVQITHRSSPWNAANFEPWVVARNIDEAVRKALKWLKEVQGANVKRYRVGTITEHGTIDVE